MRDIRFSFVRGILLSACIVAAPRFACAEPHYSLTAPLKLTYNHILDLRFEDARRSLALVRQTDPENLLPDLYDNYIDFIKAFISEEQADYRQLQVQRDRRLAKLSQKSAASPWKAYAQAQIRLQHALVSLKFGAYVTAFQEVSKAYALLENNQKHFPDFMPNRIALGVLHAAVGNIPDEYKWGVKMLSGMTGTVQQGLSEIESVVEYGRSHPEFVHMREALVIFGYMTLLLQNDQQKAWATISHPLLNAQSSPLAAFALAVVAIRTGRNDAAIRYLMQAPRTAAYYNFSYLDYLLGLAKLQRLDADANVYIERYLRTFKGRLSIKEAWMRLGWYHIIHDDLAGYERCRQKVLSEGQGQRGGDRSAYNDAKSGIVPHKVLLQARLLFDGGYYARAEALLTTLSETDFTHEMHRLEWQYRQARVAQMLRKYSQALELYKNLLSQPQASDSYFACNGALQAGIICEHMGNKAQAHLFFKKCLAIYPPEYSESLHALAKAGLQRLQK